MNEKPNRKRPSLIRHTRNSLSMELRAWKGLIRTEWKWILTALVVLLALAIFSRPLPPSDVYLAVGQPGSVFETLGKKYVTYFAQEGVKLHLVNTSGSASSLAELADKNTQVNAALMVGGIAAKGKFPNLVSLGSIEYVPLWLFYRGSEFQGGSLFDHFASKRVAVSVDGSAEKVIVGKILKLYGMTLEGRDNLLEIPDKEAVQKLIDGEIDAMCLMDGIDGPNIQRLLENENIHIANFIYAPAYVKKLPFLSTVVIPRGSLGLKEHRPEQDIQMLASTATLLVEKDMHPVIQQLFLLASDKISSEIDQFFANPDFFPAYVDHSVALSPVAKQYFESGPPPFRNTLPLWLTNYVSRIWLLLLGALAFVYPLSKLFPGYRNMRSTVLVTDAYTLFQEFEVKLSHELSSQELQEIIDELNALEDDNTEDWFTSVEMRTVFSMKRDLDKLRQKAIDKKRALEASESSLEPSAKSETETGAEPDAERAPETTSS